MITEGTPEEVITKECMKKKYLRLMQRLSRFQEQINQFFLTYDLLPKRAGGSIMRTMKKNRLLLLVCFRSFDYFLLLFQMAQRLWEKQIFGRRCLILIDQNKVTKSYEIFVCLGVAGAFLVGSCFALSGALMQGVTRNPLADSGLLGINAGASLAMALSFAFWPKAS